MHKFYFTLLLFINIQVFSQVIPLSCFELETNQKLSDTEGNFLANLDANDRFGRSIASIGDFNTSGITTSMQKVSATQGDFTGTLNASNNFAGSVSDIRDIDNDDIEDLVLCASITNVGDLHNDGFNEISVGTILDDDGGTNKRAVYILSLVDPCQLSPNPPVDSCNVLFQKIINDSGNTEHLSVVIADDNTYFLAGVTTSNSLGGHDIFVNRYDASDALIWSKKLGTSSNEFSQSVPMSIMGNGDLIVACESNQFGGTSVLGNINCFRLDINGNLIWKKRLNSSFGDSQTKNIIDKGADIIITGSSRGISSGGAYDSYAIKLDGNGNTIWSTSFLGSGNDHSNGIVDLPNGNFLLSGNTTSTGSFQAGLICLIDQNGISIWNKTFDVSNAYEQIKDVRYLSDGNVICYGNTGNPSTFDLSFMKIDLNGNIIYSKMISGNGEERATEVIELADGSFLISGYTNSFGHGMFDLFLTKLSSDGDEIWTKLYGGSQNDQCHPLDNNLYLSNDETYCILAGYTQSFGSSDKDAFIIKSATTSDTICNELTGTFWNISNLTFQTNNFSLSTESLPNMVNSNFSISTNGIIEDTLCIQLCSIVEPNCSGTQFNDTICLGDSVQVNVDLGLNYSWAPSLGISNVNIQNPMLFPMQNTIYIVTYETLDAC
jgi:hypothetical protein